MFHKATSTYYGNRADGGVRVLSDVVTADTEVEAPTLKRRSFGDRILLVQLHTNDDKLYSWQPFQCEGATPLKIRFRRNRKHRRNTWRIPLVRLYLLVTSFRMCALQTRACPRTHLERSHAALCPCILALHIIHVRRFVLTLVVEPAAK